MFEPPGPRPFPRAAFNKAITEWRRLRGFTAATHRKRSPKGYLLPPSSNF